MWFLYVMFICVQYYYEKSVAGVERDNDVVTDMRWQQWQRRGLSITHGQVMALMVVGSCHAAVYILTTSGDGVNK